jgi:hypothetical protein
MPRYIAANDIINQVCMETGLVTNTDPVASTEDTYIQLTALLTSAGQELVEMHPWQALRSVYSITTTNTGSYPLPDDFCYMIDQTGWNRSSRFPVAGPLSGQQWSFLEGVGLTQTPLYATFRLMDSTFNLLPNPPPNGVNITLSTSAVIGLESQIRMSKEIAFLLALTLLCTNQY